MTQLIILINFLARACEQSRCLHLPPLIVLPYSRRLMAYNLDLHKGQSYNSVEDCVHAKLVRPETNLVSVRTLYAQIRPGKVYVYLPLS
jgi:hypothetical protein